MQPHHIFWAKTSKTIQDIHPLICHMVDTGQVAKVLWNSCLARSTRQFFSDKLGLEELQTGKLISFWVSLHDIGKAAPSFQRKHDASVLRLNEAGFIFPAPTTSSAPHGVVTAWALEQLLREQFDLEPSIAKRIARVLGGHHGTWPTSSQLLPNALKLSDKGDTIWQSARRALVGDLTNLFQPPEQFSWPDNQADENAFLVLLSGLTSVADWIGSMEDFFPYQTGEFELVAYGNTSLEQAEQALNHLGWKGWQATGEPIEFDQMFPFTPNEIQHAVIQKGQQIDMPALLILEAPTGSGKTEAALYLADTWLQRTQGRGLYVAMPTMATSNQMFDRVSKFMLNRYSGEKINLHLVHSAQLLAAVNHTLSSISDSENSPTEGGIRTETWFLPRKRTLLAPFGVGTVDQAFLSVLQTRHFFVRMFGLGQKVVIFDEIHAYDTYMSELFQQLLSWLHGIGSSVILLSATLQEAARQKLVSAWGAGETKPMTGEYPRLTIVTPSDSQSFCLPWSKSRTIHITRMDTDPHAVAALLKDRLKDGGCAAVICNRVVRSIEMYRAFEQANIVDPQELILFHARFPYAWRQGIENIVLERFKKGGQRPHKAIVVATQVIEQSLDLDFDIMVSDLAPIDLILQRAGRLHRHEQNNTIRPAELQEPHLVLTSAVNKDQLPVFGGDEWVYDESILLRTWAVLQDYGQISIPADTSPLIEAVYGDGRIEEYPEQLKKAIQLADKKARDAYQHAVFEAKKRLIPNLEDEQLIFSQNEALEEEDPTVHQSISALTRLGNPSVRLVCLFQTPGGLALDPQGPPILENFDTVPTVEQIQHLLQSVVSVQNYQVTRYFSSKPLPKAWYTCAALRHHHPVVFDSEWKAHLEDAQTRLTLELDKKLGLIID